MTPRLSSHLDELEAEDAPERPPMPARIAASNAARLALIGSAIAVSAETARVLGNADRASVRSRLSTARASSISCARPDALEERAAPAAP